MLKSAVCERPTRPGWSLWVIVTALVAGCASAQTRRYDGLARDLRDASARPGEREDAERRGAIEDAARLDRAGFVRAVLASNPSIEAARQGWRAALAEYPQTSALPDPTLDYSMAPLSIGSQSVPYGQTIGLSQRLPWPGRLALQGEVALAEAEAAREDYQATRQRLALTASMLFDQYYAVTRSIALTREHQRLTKEIKSAAEAQYEAGRASQQEPLQAEVEDALVAQRGVVLESRRSVIVAQMNGMLHRRPGSPLPPPPERVDPELDAVIEGSESLQSEAVRGRPELRKSLAQIRGRESAVDLADKAYYPDFTVNTSYSTMWMDPEHQWMVGLSINIPLQRGARNGAADGAEARLAQARSELASVDDEIRVEVERARQRLIEARDVVRLYQERLLPAARAQIEAATIGYETGTTGFQALIDSERTVRAAEIEHQEAIATLGQRRAELDYAVGRVAGISTEGDKQ